MSPDQIEKEIQERVKFKLKEILTGVENEANADWQIAFKHNSPKHMHYSEALRKLRIRIINEANMACPYDNMTEKIRKEKRNIAIEKLTERLIKRGEHGFTEKLRFMVKVLEELY